MTAAGLDSGEKEERTKNYQTAKRQKREEERDWTACWDAGKVVGSHQKHNQKTILRLQDRTGKVSGLHQQIVPQKQGDGTIKRDWAQYTWKN